MQTPSFPRSALDCSFGNRLGSEPHLPRLLSFAWLHFCRGYGLQSPAGLSADLIFGEARPPVSLSLLNRRKRITTAIKSIEQCSLPNTYPRHPPCLFATRPAWIARRAGVGDHGRSPDSHALWMLNVKTSFLECFSAPRWAFFFSWAATFSPAGLARSLAG